jgi:ribosomal protein S6--L-glutamate ligase
MAKKQKILIGWEEWCAFPGLKLPAIKAKIDTGAKTSCLHAFNIETYTEQGQRYVRFSIHPMQNSKRMVRVCTAMVVDYRYVTNSGGKKEKRYVVQSTIAMNGRKWLVELTLAKRDTMSFRMLLGREAMRKGGLVVDPSKSCALGKISREDFKQLYEKSL